MVSLMQDMSRFSQTSTWPSQMHATLNNTFSPSLATIVCAVFVAFPSPSSSIISLAIESKSLVRCFATIKGWFPFDKMSSRSAEDEK